MITLVHESRNKDGGLMRIAYSRVKQSTIRAYSAQDPLHENKILSWR